MNIWKSKQKERFAYIGLQLEIFICPRNLKLVFFLVATKNKECTYSNKKIFLLATKPTNNQNQGQKYGLY